MEQKMNRKEFAIHHAANNIRAVFFTPSPMQIGWNVFIDLGIGGLMGYTTARGEIRVFKTIDSLVAELYKAGWHTDVICKLGTYRP